MTRFNYKSGVPQVPYNQQGYVYFTSINYKNLPPDKREKIKDLCKEAAGVYWKALFDFVTTSKSCGYICEAHYISKPTLYRALRKYYSIFPKQL